MLVNSLPNLEQNMGFKVVLAGLSWILETLPIISSMNLKMNKLQLVLRTIWRIR